MATVTSKQGENRRHVGKVSRLTFDLSMAEEAFPTNEAISKTDESLTQAVLKRNLDLTPNPEEQAAVASLVSHISLSLESLTIDPPTPDIIIDEFRKVGSFQFSTMLRGSKAADIVVILRTLPFKESIEKLAEVIVEKASHTPSHSLVKKATDYGADITDSKTGTSVRILITTAIGNLRKIDPTVHISADVCHRHLAAVRHAKWFEDSSVSSTTVKVNIRVIKDIVGRFPPLKPLNPWIISVLSHYAVFFRHSEEPLGVGQAFRRFFQLLAAGILLPGSASLPDPCESGTVSLSSKLTLNEMDQLCMSCQTILRILSLPGGPDVILGFLPNTSILDAVSTWEGVVVSPPIRVVEQIDS